MQSIGVKCPVCGRDIVARRSKKGRVFYGCSGYPACKTIYWYKPSGKLCPHCGAMLLEKKGRNYSLVCADEECGYKE